MRTQREDGVYKPRGEALGGTSPVDRHLDLGLPELRTVRLSISAI